MSEPERPRADEQVRRFHAALRRVYRMHGVVKPIFAGNPSEAAARRALAAQVRDVDALPDAPKDGGGDFYYDMAIAVVLDTEGPFIFRAAGFDVAKADDFWSIFCYAGEKIPLHNALARAAWRVGAWLEWARSGFHVVRLSALQAAAFAWSQETVDPATIGSPWRAFAIDVPPGLLRWHGRVSAKDGIDSFDPSLRDRAFDTHITRICVHDEAGGEGRFISMNALADDGSSNLVGPPINCAELLSPTWHVEQAVNEDDARTRRMWQCCARMALSTMISLSDPDRVRRYEARRSGKAAPKWRQASLQGLDYVELDQPIKVDVAEIVARYVASGDTSNRVGVRVLVRGHHRNQPCGPRKSQRKTIWIDPFWRGPEDAPIAVHPHVLTDAAAESGAELP